MKGGNESVRQGGARPARTTLARLVLGIVALAPVVAACAEASTGRDSDAIPAAEDGANDGGRGAAGETSAGQPPAEVRSIDCPFDTTLVSEVECGRITVPGRGVDPDFEVELSFARFLATGSGSDVQPDPVVFLHGGPGSSILEWAPLRYDSLVSPFIDERDVILYDQRGAGLSSPMPRCHQVERVSFATLTEQFDHDELVEEMVAALEDCAARRFGSGKVDPTAFSTVVNVQDLVALLDALDVSDYNLVGSSYGSRLAQAVLRDAPEGVRSVAITGVYPTDVSPFAHIPATAEIALERVFAGCAADERCHEALPDPWASLDALRVELDRDPTWAVDIPSRGPITPEVFSGRQLLSAIHSLLYSGDGAGMISDLLIDVEDGDRSRLRRLAENMVPVNSFMMTGLLVVCADERPFPFENENENENENEDEDEDEAASGRFSAADWDDALGLLGSHTPTYCDALGVDWAAGSQNDPVTWDVPTLILTGAADPITPETWARRLAERLPRSRLLVNPTATHDAISGWCASRALDRFVDRPDHLSDVSCIDPSRLLQPNNKALRFDEGVEWLDQTLDLDGTDAIEARLPNWLPYWAAASHVRWRDLDPLDLSVVLVRSPTDTVDVLDLLGFEWYAGSWSATPSPLSPAGWERSERASFVATMVRYVEESSGVALVLVAEAGDPDDLEREVLAPMARSLEVVTE